MDEEVILIKKPILKLIEDKVPIFLLTDSIKFVISEFQKNINKYETIDYLYVVDNNKKLKGVLSIKELFKCYKEDKLEKFIGRKLITVRVHTEQEKLAMVALKNNLKEVPVISKTNEFLGVVPYNSILKIMHEEGVDNILKIGGVISSSNDEKNIQEISIKTAIKNRLLWLIIGLFGGLFVAVIVKNHEETLAFNIILAAFIPLIVYMSNAVGAQMQAFLIRDFALKPNLNILKYFLKNVLIIIILAFVLSLLLFGISYLMYYDSKISMVLGFALFFATLSSLLTGILLPYLFKRKNLDPANASGPIGTIIQDFFSIVIYLSIASFFLL